MGGLLSAGQLLLSGSFLTFLFGLYIGYKWLPSLLSKTPAPVRDVLAALEEDLTAHLNAEITYTASKLRASLGLVSTAPPASQVLTGTLGTPSNPVTLPATPVPPPAA